AGRFIPIHEPEYLSIPSVRLRVNKPSHVPRAALRSHFPSKAFQTEPSGRCRPGKGLPAMVFGSRLLGPWQPIQPFKARTRSSRLQRNCHAECLEARSLLTASVPDIAMISATTTDSRSVALDYQIQNASISGPLTFGVYRSADSLLDASDVQ